MNPHLFRFVHCLILTSVLSFASHDASAQNRMLAEFPIDIQVQPYTIGVEGCDYQNPSFLGAALIFECDLSDSYKVTLQREGDDEPLIKYAVMELRSDAAAASFEARPVHVLRAAYDDQSSAAAAYAALPAALRPLGKAQVTPASDSDVVPVAPATPDPEPASTEAPAEHLAKFQWPKQIGALRLTDGRPIVVTSEDALNLYGEVSMAEPAGAAEVQSVRNPACVRLARYSSLAPATPLLFDCTAIEVALPFSSAALNAAGCERTEADGLTCLHPLLEPSMTLTAPGWRDVNVSVAPDGSTSQLGAGDFVPAVTLGALSEALVQSSASACGVGAAVRLDFMGYCSADTCVDYALDDRNLAGRIALPDLATAGWTMPELPVAFLVGMTGADQTVTETSIPLDSGAQAALEALAMQSGDAQTVPLTVELDSSQYRFGRQLRMFTDVACEVSFNGQLMDLSNPGNRAPHVPQCSFFQVFEEGKVRSKCTQIAYNPDTSRATATLPEEACGTERMVLVVAESSSLNGRAGNAIVSSLTDLIREMNASEQCMQLDVVRARGDRRELLLEAEDIYFTPQTEELERQIRMDFVNASSEVLRDFDWVYRTWGDELSGVVFVGDADQVRATDMIESPAAMAWKIKGVGTSALVFGASEGCSTFSDTLLFSECIQADFEGLTEQLVGMVKQGIAASIGDR